MIVRPFCQALCNNQIYSCASYTTGSFNLPFITQGWRGQILELPFEILWLDKANEYIRKNITALWIIYVEVWFETVSSFPNGNSCCYLIDGHTAHTQKKSESRLTKFALIQMMMTMADVKQKEARRNDYICLFPHYDRLSFICSHIQ